MPYRNKTYVAFDGDTDIHYYRLMTAWAENANIDFDFYNAHDINSARDSSQIESIKRQLRERINNSKLFILLIGDETKYSTKFVKWEIEKAIELDIPIIAVNLNSLRSCDDSRCPSVLQPELAIHISFERKIIKYAMDNWIEAHSAHKRAGDTGAYFYKESVYKSLGL